MNPLMIGLAGPSGSGKTFSGLRLATGIQRVLGGEIYGIDTEGGRMLHYAKMFNFRYLRLDPPHGPLDYYGAIDHCVNKKAKIILIDSMTHEHSGDGGVLDQVEAFLKEKCGDNWAKRQAMNQLAHVKPKEGRKALNRRIKQLTDVIFILCYQAETKIKPKRKTPTDQEGGMIDLGWQPDTTSKLVFDMTARFLLLPGCDGKPTFQPETAAERLSVKNPIQFRGWFQDGLQLNEDLGVKMAKWHLGKEEGEPAKPYQPSKMLDLPEQAPAPSQPIPPADPKPVKLSALALGMKSKFLACTDDAMLKAAWEEFNAGKGALTTAERVSLSETKDAVKASFANAQVH
jgi:hypothetical protein